MPRITRSSFKKREKNQKTNPCLEVWGPDFLFLLPFSGKSQKHRIIGSSIQLLYQEGIVGCQGYSVQVSERIQEKINKEPKASALIRSTTPVPADTLSLLQKVRDFERH